MDEDTRETYQVRSSQLPPFASFMAVPVRFGGQVIALIEVGWRSARAIPRDDADLLDAVTRYLAVQLVGAFSALRTQRREQLARAPTTCATRWWPSRSERGADALLQAWSATWTASARRDGPSPSTGHEVVHLPVAAGGGGPAELLPGGRGCHGAAARRPARPLARRAGRALPRGPRRWR